MWRKRGRSTPVCRIWTICRTNFVLLPTTFKQSTKSSHKITWGYFGKKYHARTESWIPYYHYKL